MSTPQQCTGVLMRNWIMLITVVSCAACTTVDAPAPEDSSLAQKRDEKASAARSDPKLNGAASTATSDPKLNGSGNAIGSAALNKTANDEPEVRHTIEEIATEADQTAVDGWFYGQDPRFFKSFYRKIPAKVKTDFAMAYHDWLKQSNQDLVRDFKSYVPYSKRADYAFAWWGEHEPNFKKEALKMQVLWAHESIQDAGELWWRANEKLHPDVQRFDQTVAHDEEQKMVAQFREDENTPGRISDQIWKREHR